MVKGPIVIVLLPCEHFPTLSASGGSVLVQRTSLGPLAAALWGDLRDWSLVASASSVRSGEPAGLRHAGGAELGLHTGDARTDNMSYSWILSVFVNHLLFSLAGRLLGIVFLSARWCGSAHSWSLSEVPDWQTIQWPPIRGNEAGDASTLIDFQYALVSWTVFHVFSFFFSLFSSFRCLTLQASYV